MFTVTFYPFNVSLLNFIKKCCFERVFSFPFLPLINIFWLTSYVSVFGLPPSISEPSLFTPGQRAVFEGFSKNRHPLFRKRGGPSLPSCKTPENTKTPQQSYHQVYMHFSQPLRPAPKPGQTLPRSQRRPTESRERQCKQPVNLETLSVRGKTFLPTRHSPDGASSATSRSHTHQLHVFLPAGGAGPGEDRDSESVDEGFIMDELDSKVNTLRARLQQYPKKPKQCDLEKSLTGEMVQLTS